MSLRARLLEARGIIAGGWSEPFTTSADGVHCQPFHEDAARFSVVGALIVAGVYPEGWERLEDVARPAHAWLRDVTREELTSGISMGGLALAARAAVAEGEHFQVWLEAPGRQLGEVLTVFDRAILNASRENGT